MGFIYKRRGWVMRVIWSRRDHKPLFITFVMLPGVFIGLISPAYCGRRRDCNGVMEWLLKMNWTPRRFHAVVGWVIEVKLKCPSS